MSPTVDVNPARECEHCYFVAELLQHPEFPLLIGGGRCGALGRHQVVVVKAALGRLYVAQVSCGSTFAAE